MLTQELLLFCQVIIHTGVEVNGEVICLLQLHWNPPLPEHVICVEDGLVVQGDVAMCIQSLEDNELVDGVQDFLLNCEGG